MKTKLFLLFFSFLSFGSIEASQQAEFSPKVMKEAGKLPQYGILRQNSSGFIYLEVPQNYIDKTKPHIGGKGIVKPPSKTGAHISVMYPEEVKNNHIYVSEIGKKIFFSIKGFYSSPVNWTKHSIDKVYYVEVRSPELEHIRQKYGLSRHLKGQQFHITVAAHQLAMNTFHHPKKMNTKQKIKKSFKAYRKKHGF
jgi:hypothetical protein